MRYLGRLMKSHDPVNRLIRPSLCLAVVCAGAMPLKAEQYRVRDQAEYTKALKQVQAGDTIVLASGEWRNFNLIVTGKGAPGKPIMVTAEEAGKSSSLGGQACELAGTTFSSAA